MNPEPGQEDLAKMRALQQKRLLAFVNHSVTMNVKCLDKFMLVCEEKLMLFEEKLDRVDAAMILLESKLLSAPELNTYMEAAAPVLEPIQEIPQQADTEEDTVQSTKVNTDDNQSAVSRPQYDRFLKMVQVGVPLQAAKIKCALEGLDPDVLTEILGK